MPRGAKGELAIKLPLPPGTLLTVHNNEQVRGRHAARLTCAVSALRQLLPETLPRPGGGCALKLVTLTDTAGFYDLGDEGFIDETGYVHVLGRSGACR